MKNDERSLLPEKPSSIARVGERSRQITRGIDRLRQIERRFIELPTPSGANSEARAINNRGQIVGRVGAADRFPFYDSKAVLWEQGRMVYLQTCPGWLSSAYDINDLGQIVGVEHRRQYMDFHIHDDFEEPRAILWDNHQRFELERFEYGCAGAYAINNIGQIAGWVDVPAILRPSRWSALTVEPRGRWRGDVEIGESRAVLWHEGQMTELETLGEDAGIDAHDEAYGINNQGVVVGSCHGTATLWTNGHGTELPLDATGDVIGSEAHAINDRGEIVGSVSGYGSDSRRDVLWHAGGFLDLGPSMHSIWGTHLRINNRGQIVGLQSNTTDEPQASLWEDNRKIDLHIPSEGASFALNINDLGQAIGRYGDVDVGWRACLWQ